jgi:hypothetical protein
MKLNVSSPNIDSDAEFDLDDLMDNMDMVDDEGTLHTALIIEIARWSLEHGQPFDDAYPTYVEDDNGHELWVHGDSQSNPDWIKEVAQFAWFIRQEKDSWVDDDLIFAYVNGEDWRYVDFDRLSDWQDNYSQEYEGDAEEFARQWMSDVGDESLPDHLEPYFDYESYGEAMLNDYNQYEWNDRTFLFHQ